AKMIQDIIANKTSVAEAAAHDERFNKFDPIGTNAATQASLEVFQNKLDVTNTDTSAFAVQYRTSFADYQRLVGEATHILGSVGGKSNDPLGAAGGAMGSTNLKLNPNQPGLERFRQARAQLNTAAHKMDGTMARFRGSSQLLQSKLYKLRQAAADQAAADATN